MVGSDRASGRTARAQVLLDGDPGTALLLLPAAAVVSESYESTCAERDVRGENSWKSCRQFTFGKESSDPFDGTG